MKEATYIIKRTISGIIGKGDTYHNNRKIITENVDTQRISDNIIIKQDDIKSVYHELFDNALSEYNAKQKRSDRVIKNYHEHIRHSRQEKEFHEVIFQIGNCEDTAVGSETAKIAAELLKQFAVDFENRNPHIKVFNSVIHMDEATPHLHIDFVPFATEQKRGLSTRVSLSKALEQQGFVSEGKFNTCSKLWIDSEKQHLSELMFSRGIDWERLGNQKEHLSILDYKKQERQKEVAHLENKIECTDKILKSREKIVADAETLIDKLDCKYQEKQQAVQDIEEEFSEKSSALNETASNLAEQQALLNTTAKKASKIKNIDDISVKKTLFGGNVTVSQADFDGLSGLAKKQIASERTEKQLSAENEQLKKDKNLLSDENEALKKEIGTLKSIRNQLNISALKSELDDMKRKYQKVMDFINSLGLKEKLQVFLHPQQKNHNMHR